MMFPVSRRRVLNASVLGLAAGALGRRTQAADGPTTTSRPSNSIRTPRVPNVAGRFINIYKPQPDVFTLPTVTTKPIDGNFTYGQGQT